MSSVNTRSFDKALKKLSKDAPVSLEAIVRDQDRLWAKALIKFTPPKSATQGKKAIKSDLFKIFNTITPKGRLKFFHDNFPKHRDMFNTSTTGAKDFHQRQRTRRGRVVPQRSGGKVQVGRWKFNDVMFLGKPDFNRYFKKVAEGVGKLVAGWIPKANLHKKTKLPKWVQKQKIRQGYAKDKMKKGKGKGSLISGNTTPYVHIIKRVVKFTQKVRQKDLNKHAIKRMKKLARQFSKA